MRGIKNDKDIIRKMKIKGEEYKQDGNLEWKNPPKGDSKYGV